MTSFVMVAVLASKQSEDLTRGKNPIHSTKEGDLEKLSSSYPIVDMVICYRKSIKAKTSYFQKLATLNKYNIMPRFNFNIYAD